MLPTHEPFVFVITGLLSQMSANATKENELIIAKQIHKHKIFLIFLIIISIPFVLIKAQNVTKDVEPWHIVYNLAKEI